MKDFEDYSFSSGDEYADILIENLIASDDLNEELPEDLVKYWAEEIRKICNERYALYIKGEADDYRLYERDMLDTYKKASLKATQDIIRNLVEKGEVQMAVNDQGEIVYGSKDWDWLKNKTKRKKN